MDYILASFRITENEYSVLDKKYGELCEWMSWQLYGNNYRLNYVDDQTDISQELRMAMIKAGAYFKRQTYIETCLNLCGQYSKDFFTKLLVESLVELWHNKTKHGANRQKFGPYQERILENLVQKIVPKKCHPSKSAPLIFNDKFNIYCKAITWNRLKTLGKSYTREKPIREHQVSLAEFDYLAETY